MGFLWCQAPRWCFSIIMPIILCYACYTLPNPLPNSSPMITIGSQVWLNPPNNTASTNKSGQNQNRPSPKRNLVVPHAKRIPMLITLTKSTAITIQILIVNIALSSWSKLDFSYYSSYSTAAHAPVNF